MGVLVTMARPYRQIHQAKWLVAGLSENGILLLETNGHGMKPLTIVGMYDKFALS